MSIVSSLLLGGCQGRELLGELEADRYADEHPQPGLLGDQRTHRGYPLLRILMTRGLPQRLLVPLIEPAAVLEREPKHTLKRGRRPRHQLLRPREPARFGDRGDRGVELGVCIGAIGQCVAIIRTWPFR